MPAKSKSQQRFMGMVHSYQKSGGKASKAVKDAAKSMSDKDAEDYASTKHDALKEKLRNLIKQEIKSIDEAKMTHVLTKDIGKKKMKDLEQYLWHVLDLAHNKDFRLSSNGKILSVNVDKINRKSIQNIKKRYGVDLKESVILEWNKYHLGGLLDSKLKKRLERTIRIIGGKVDSVGMDYITFRIGGMDLKRLPSVIKKLDRNKNVWIGDKQKNNIWDRRRNIDKLNKEATTSVSVPGYLTPDAFQTSTQKAIDIDDEDDEKSESMAAPFRRRKSRGLGRPMKVGINERKLSSHQKKAILIAIEMSGNMTGATKKIEKIKRGLSKDKKVKDALRLANESVNEYHKFRGKMTYGGGKPKKGDYVKTIAGIAQIEKIKGSIAYMKLPGKKTKGYWMNDLKNLKPTDEKEKGKTLWTESINESDLGLTYKKGKTVKVTHKKSGKELVIIDKPNVKREYEKIGYFAEGQVNEISMKMQPFSSKEAKLHINSDIKDMSKYLGKASQQVIKIMMDGVRKGKYTAMDISRGIHEGPAKRTHFGEMTFIQSLWNKMREKFRKYSKDGKLS